MKAILQHVQAQWQQTGSGPQVSLFHGARHPWHLYDHQFFRDLAAEAWFSYTPVVSDDISFPGQKGMVGDVAAASGNWSGHHVYICGSSKMIEFTAAKLRAANVAPERIHFEDFAMDAASSSGHGTKEVQV